MTCPKCKGPTVEYVPFVGPAEQICENESNCLKPKVSIMDLDLDWEEVTPTLPIPPPMPPSPTSSKSSAPSKVIGAISDDEKRQIINAALDNGWITSKEARRRLDEIGRGPWQSYKP